MNEVSADHASMYHTGITIRHKRRNDFRSVTALRYELLPSGLTFMSCVSVTGSRR